METNEKEWQSIIALNIVSRLLQLNAENKICWACIGESGNFRNVQTEDFEMLHKAIRNGYFKGSAAIVLWEDGTGLVGWKLDAAEKGG